VIKNWDAIRGKAKDIIGADDLKALLKQWWDAYGDDQYLKDKNSRAAENDKALALLSGGETPALFSWSIGPVQGFIAKARRTADLWAGSKIISDLASEACRVLSERYGPWCVIFPSLRGQPVIEEWLIKNEVNGIEERRHLASIAALPNRLTAIIPMADVRTVAEEIETAVGARWSKYVDDALKYISSNGFEADPELVKCQRNTEFRTSWSAYEAKLGDGSRDDYSASWKESARLFNGMRSGRPFAIIGEVGIKCSLCGEREALRPAGVTANGSFKSYKEQLDSEWNLLCEKDKKGYFRKGKDEKLCTVCITKRLYPLTQMPERLVFPSTHEIGLPRFREDLREGLRSNETLKQKYDAFRDYLEEHENLLDEEAIRKLEISETDNGKGINGTWFIKSFFAAMDEPEKHKSESEEMERLRRNFRQACGEASIPYPKGFYTILRMDGDKMGSLLMSGVDKGGVTQEFHSTLSGRLNLFSIEEAPKIVEKHKGKLIYSGGDDVLAMMPVESALECAKELSETYDSTIIFEETSLSGAILFPHALMPVGPLLNDSHELLKEVAKKELGRNALAYRVMQRGGVRLKGGFKWQETKQNASCEDVDWSHEIGEIRRKLGRSLGSTKMYQLIKLSQKLEEKPDVQAGQGQVESSTESNETGKALKYVIDDDSYKLLLTDLIYRSGVTGANEDDATDESSSDGTKERKKARAKELAKTMHLFLASGQKESLKFSRFLATHSLGREGGQK